jgi:hypothetical protein
VPLAPSLRLFSGARVGCLDPFSALPPGGHSLTIRLAENYLPLAHTDREESGTESLPAEERSHAKDRRLQ